MDANQITTVLNAILSGIFLIISLRAFYLYIRVRSSRLFVLALSMATITLTTTFDTFGDSITRLTHIQLNTDWFLFVGQAIGFLFFFLSIVLQDQDRLRVLVRYQVAISMLVLLPLLFLPAIPALSNPLLRLTLSGSRSIICFTIFFYYVTIFTRKETRFSLLMIVSFLLLSFGYLVLLPTYLLPNQDVLDHIGDIVRICGLTLMLMGFILP
ncbi:MAG TPA: hypothetical protein VKR06_10750 [Ktedonosporobacter sp.]|nr:hypothetical protein [Ktedonosporobacter sp.]